MSDIKSWIVEERGGSVIVVCPYCKHWMKDPAEKCERCGQIVEMPKKQAKKEWW
jgi:uncharacterized C2H2 Zn-finger protein